MRPVEEGPMEKRQQVRSPGFTLVELFIVMAILGVVVLFGLPALQNLIARSKHEASARTLRSLMYQARMEAVHRGVPTVVTINPATGTAMAFANVDLDAPLAFTPSDPASSFRNDDYQIGGDIVLGRGVSFAAPPGDGDGVVAGLTDVTWSTPNVAVFEPSGAIRAVGAFRTADLRDNFLEVRCEPRATARTFIQKWNASGGGYWHAPGEGPGGKPWTWN
jgi:prepilin-type N-terminal cleavage/methylation domain-containing protein